MDTIKYIFGITFCAIGILFWCCVVVIIETLTAPDEMLGIEPEKIEPEHDDLVLAS